VAGEVGDLGSKRDIEKEDEVKSSEKEITMVIPHSTGIFQHQVHFCSCPGAVQKHIQLFRAGLFPASIQSPKTAFTFDVLDHFRVDAMECKTSAMSFFQKLQCFTNNAFPHTVKVSDECSGQ
jgi:hypothetical protein